MVNEKDVPENLEWSINVADGTKKVVAVPELRLVNNVWLGSKSVVGGLIFKVWRFLVKAWNLGVAEPKKVIHAVKVGLALTIVSLCYYIRSLYEGVGGNAMWAVMTVVVVFESSVGATLYKSINRVTATFLAGSLGLGVHWISYKAGEKFEPIIIGISVFFLASAATFSRFIPSVKSRFDYGALIFILTFSLVSVSGYRVDGISELAFQRLSTIFIGTSFCILISILFYPTWAGAELHRLIYRNLEKLADSLDGYVIEYLDNEAVAEDSNHNKAIKGYKYVLDSKAAEDNLAKFARWEPAHGCFNFQHPWKQYLKIGASIRSSAYCIEALSGCMDSEIQAPGIGYLKKHVSNACTTMNNSSSDILRELAITLKTMTKSSQMGSLVREMNIAVQQLQISLGSIPNCLIAPTSEDTTYEPFRKTCITPLVEVIPLTTFVSLLIENAARISGIVDAVNELAGMVDMKHGNSKAKPTQ
ncbi:aluminum-activated malate transporter 10-like [Rosa rugosa]|uniref:aluminum-activated malate transporter 10-like n=1 Tax=Rosa rugosa TaxID=74645 RepID=UPI002B407405|nr:aluminum-activated malate transporter 10-like [Rosa rugosa]